jgi:hypothetical protein
MSTENSKTITKHEKDLLDERSLYNQSQPVHYKPDADHKEMIDLEFSKLSSGQNADYANTNKNIDAITDAQKQDLTKKCN